MLITYDEAYYVGGAAGGYSDYPKTAYAHESAQARAERLIARFNLSVNESVLIVGCAYGFLVEALAELSIDAHGIDISEFAVSQAKSSRVQLGDARLESSFRKYDLILSENMICCLTDEETKVFCELAKKYSKRVVHLITDNPRLSKWYNYHTVDELKILVSARASEVWYTTSSWRN
jgi:2-polyprenyl-3-methyl-5-hydroxy-6-metoxy-1,4-benzoquinol methylase